MSFPLKKIYVCLICDKKFATRMHLMKHERLIHNIIKQYRECSIGRFESINTCLECSALFKYTGDLRNHLHQQHNIKNVVEELTFSTYDEFSFWLDAEEKKHAVKYLNHSRTKQGYIETSYLNCSQSSDHSILKGKRSKQNRNNSCTSQIIVTRDVGTDEYNIRYFKTHYGHDDDRNCLRLITVDQKKIASQLMQGVSPERILDNIYNETRPSLKRKLGIPLEQNDIPCVGNGNANQLRNEIKVKLSLLKERVETQHFPIETLSAILRELESITALISSNVETNNYKPVTHITIQPAEEGTEGQPLLVKRKFITINKANLKPYTDVKDNCLIENIVSDGSSSECSSKDRFILL